MILFINIKKSYVCVLESRFGRKFLSAPAPHP